MSEYERTPCRSYEMLSLQFLMGLSQEAHEAVKTLGKRLDTTGMKDKLEQAADDIENVVVELLRTVPVQKLGALKKNMSNLEMGMHVKREAGEPNREYTYVCTQTLRKVLRDLARERCSICLGTYGDEAECSYAKTLDEILIEDVKPNSYMCKYRDAEWGD